MRGKLAGSQFKLNFRTPSDAELRHLVDSVIAKNADMSDDEFSPTLSTTPTRPITVAESYKSTETVGTLMEKQSRKVRRVSDKYQGKGIFKLYFKDKYRNDTGSGVARGGTEGPTPLH